jgi:hypothetical protein
VAEVIITCLRRELLMAYGIGLVFDPRTEARIREV